MKQKAKQLLKENPTHKITALFLLSTLGLSLIVNLFVPNQIVTSLLEGDVTILNQGGTVALFLTILITLFGWIMSYGYKLWALRLSRGTVSPPSSLIEGFGMVGKIISLSLMKILLTYFWLALFTPVIALFLTLFVATLFQTYGLFIAIFLLFVAIFVGLCYLYLRYIMTSFILADKPEKTVGEIIRESVQLKRTCLKELLKLHLSFWKWILLYIAITIGYSLLTYGLNSLTMTGSIEELFFTQNNIAFYLSIIADWAFLMYFCPLYYTSLALFYNDLPQDTSKIYYRDNSL